MRSVWLVPVVQLVILLVVPRWCKATELIDTSNQKVVLLALPRDIQEVQVQIDVIDTLKKLLNHTSSFLAASTGIPFESVTILIPDSWDTSSGDWADFGDIPFASPLEKPSNADITVTTSEGYGSRPVAIQHGGCGTEGLRLILPMEFIVGEEADIIKDKVLAREWIKYRYGVFDENGVPGDVRFPQYYRVPGTDYDDVKINDCANIPVNYTFADKDGHNCSLQLDEASGLPIENPVCFLQVTKERNEELKSSFMDKDFIELPNVDKICGDDEHPHNGNAPNKHNVLCRGQSVLEVIQKHGDFEKKKTNSGDVETPAAVTFHLVKQQKLRIIVAVDDTIDMEDKKALLKNAIDILVYSLPDDTEFGLLKFRGDETDGISFSPLENSMAYRDNIATHVVFSFRLDPDVTPEIAIEKAIKQLVPTDYPQSGTILVASSKSPSADIDHSLLQQLSYLCLVVIVFDESVENDFRTFTEKHQFEPTCSKTILVPGNNLNALQKVYEVFDFIINQEPSQMQSILVKGTELSKETPLSFVLGDNVSSMDIWLTSEAESDVEAKEIEFVISNKSQSQPDSKRPNTNIKLFHIAEPQASTWECKLNLPDKKLLAKVITRPKEGFPVLRVNTWIAMEDTNDQDQQPIILYAEVLSGDYAIIDAHVQARVVPPDGNNETIIQLFDNGIGDPDVTKNDGIYTRYFTQFSAIGEYQVFIIAEDNGGTAFTGYKTGFNSFSGSDARYTDTQAIGMFKISADTGFTTAHKKPDDGYAPSQVLDLTAEATSTHSVYTLTFTAPGNEKDQDTAEEYFVQLFKTRDDVYKAELEEIFVKNLTKENFPRPQPYGTIEEIEIYLNDSTECNSTYYVTLRTISDKGKVSKVSNAVEIFLPLALTTNIPETSSEDTGSIQKPISSEGKKIGIATGVIVLVICTIGIIYGLFYCYNKRKSKKKEDIESTNTVRQEQQLHFDPVPPEHDDYYVNGGSVAAGSWKPGRDPISPVNSVSAKVLLYHHEQVKDAKTKHKDPPLFTLQSLNYNEREVNEYAAINGKKPKSSDQATLSAEGSLEENAQEPKNEIGPSTSEPQESKPIRRTTNV